MKGGTLEIELITNVAKLQSDMQQIKRSVRDMEGSVAGVGKSANDNFTKVGGSAKLAGHHVQNLAYQFNDVAVSLASGQKPMTVFMQQGSQIAQIMAQAGVGVGGLVKQIGAMVIGFAAAHPILLAVAAAAGVISAGIGLITGEINKNAAVQVTWTDTVLGAWDMARDYLANKLTGAFEYFGTTASQVWDDVLAFAKRALNAMIGAGQMAPNLIGTAFRTLPGMIADAFYSSVNLGIRGINSLIEKAVAAINGFAALVNPLLAKVGLSIPKYLAPSIPEIKNAYAGAASAGVAAFAKVASDTWNKDYVGEFAANLSGAAQNRARMRMAAEEAGKDVGSAGGRAAGKAFADTFADTVAKLYNDGLGDLYDTYGKAANDNFGDVLDEINAKVDARQSPFLKAAEQTAEWRGELDKLGQRLSGITNGGAFSTIAALAGGNFSAIGGNAGFLAQYISGVSWKSSSGDIKILGDEFSKALDGVFGGDGKFFKALEGAGVGSALGGLIFGQNANNQSQTGAMVGGLFGEAALQKALGSKVFGKLGAFGGPIGTIAGSLIGGLIGSIFGKSVPIERAYVSNTSNDVWGRKSNAGTSSSAGSSIQDAIAKIASTLGGTVGNYGLTFGMRDGQYRVSGNYGADVTAKNFNQAVLYQGGDQAAAMRAAILNALQDGAIQGIREGAQRLLQAGTDVEGALQKALDFQSVFDDLRARTDPLGAALDKLDKRFSDLRAIFDEAGASAEEYAQLEQLITAQRNDAITEQTNKRRELEVRLLAAQGDAVGALALQRVIELSTTEDSLKALQQQVYAAEDAATAMEQATNAMSAISDQLRRFRDELTGGSSIGTATYGSSLAQLMATGALASAGNMNALAGLPDVGRTFLGLSKDQASSSAQYQRDVAMVRNYLNNAISVSDGGGLSTLDAATASAGLASSSTVASPIVAELQAVRSQLSQSQSEVRAANEALVIANNKMARIIERWDRGGSLAVVTDADQPLATVAA